MGLKLSLLYSGSEAVWVDQFYECDDGLTCRNPLSLISPRPSAPSPSLVPLLSRSSISPSTDVCTHTYKHADTHLLYICTAFIRLGLDVCCCPVASLQSNRRSTDQISIPLSSHRVLCIFHPYRCFLKIHFMYLSSCVPPFLLYPREREIVSLCHFWDNPIHC